MDVKNILLVVTVLLIVMIGVCVIQYNTYKKSKRKEAIEVEQTTAQRSIEDYYREIQAKAYLGYIKIGGYVYEVDKIKVVAEKKVLEITRDESLDDSFQLDADDMSVRAIFKMGVMDVVHHLLYAQYSYRGWQFDQFTKQLEHPLFKEVFGDIELSKVMVLYSTKDDRRIRLVPARYDDNGWILDGREGPVAVLAMNDRNIEWVIPYPTDVIITYGEFIQGLLDAVKQIVDAYYQEPGYAMDSGYILDIIQGRKSHYFEMVAKFVDQYQPGTKESV